MLRTLLILSSALLFSCSSKIKKEDLTQLNGYWEIKSVTFKDGGKKEYNMSTTVDYLELKDSSGFRKKVQPKFNGTYDTSNDAENFTIIKTGDTYAFKYKNGLSEWKEELISLSENDFSVKNDQNKTYTYQRYTPLNISE